MPTTKPEILQTVVKPYEILAKECFEKYFDENEYAAQRHLYAEAKRLNMTVGEYSATRSTLRYMLDGQRWKKND